MYIQVCDYATILYKYVHMYIIIKVDILQPVGLHCSL